MSHLLLVSFSLAPLVFAALSWCGSSRGVGLSWCGSLVVWVSRGVGLSWCGSPGPQSAQFTRNLRALDASLRS